MTPLMWLKRRGPCQVSSRSLGDWQVVEVSGRLTSGEAGKKLIDEVGTLLQGGARRVVVDLTGSHLGDDTVASAAPEAFHLAKSMGAEIRFVVLPGRAGGYYHMAGLEMTIPTYSRLGGAIEI